MSTWKECTRDFGDEFEIVIIINIVREEFRHYLDKPAEMEKMSRVIQSDLKK